jgi:membrane-bound ClpP family serine protease
VEPGEFAIDVSVSPWIIGVVVVVGVVYAWVLVRALMQMRRTGVLANKPVVALVGGMGTAQTLIAPRGIAYAGGESWSARSRGTEIGAGSPLRVVGVEGLELIVEPASAADDAATEE